MDDNYIDNEWKQNIIDEKNIGDEENNGDEPDIFYEQEEEEKSKKPIFLRILALLIVLVFMGFIFMTTWPSLTLPSLDFLFQSKKLSEDPSINCLKQYVVQINVISRPGKGAVAQKSGTGFNISPDGLIITNRHVLSDAVSVTVTFPGDKTYQAKNFKNSVGVDLACIYLGAKELPAATLNMERRAEVGDKVIIIGNPLGIDNVIMEGTVSGYLRVSGCAVPVFVIDAPVRPGNSGSPVFDKNKEVVGVVFGTVCNKDNSKQLGVAIPAEEVFEFLRKD